MTIEQCLNGLTHNGIIVPNAKIRYYGKFKTYITFFKLADKINACDTNTARYNTRYYTLDVYSDADPEALVDEVVQRLINGGYTPTGTGQDQYEEDTKLYHTTIDFYKNLGGIINNEQN